jgi:hypothetical protein
LNCLSQLPDYCATAAPLRRVAFVRGGLASEFVPAPIMRENVKKESVPYRTVSVPLAGPVDLSALRNRLNSRVLWEVDEEDREKAAFSSFVERAAEFGIRLGVKPPGPYSAVPPPDPYWAALRDQSGEVRNYEWWGSLDLRWDRFECQAALFRQ